MEGMKSQTGFEYGTLFDCEECSSPEHEAQTTLGSASAANATASAANASASTANAGASVVAASMNAASTEGVPKPVELGLETDNAPSWTRSIRAAYDGLDLALPQRPVTYDSICSGMRQCFYSLQAPALVNAVCRFSVDCKPAAIEFTKASASAASCHFEDLRTLHPGQTRRCSQPGWCKVPDTAADIMSISASCKPYSALRVGRYDAQNVERHPDYWMQRACSELALATN